MLNKLEAAQRLINAATGDPHGDGERVTSVGVGYAEPGYHDDETVWVLGDWNPTRFVRPGDGQPPLTNAESIGPRLFDALERIGVQGEWLDEWEQCEDCQRIFRREADSYSWQPFYVDVGGDNGVYYLCGDCATKEHNVEEVMALFINNPDKCITTWFTVADLEAQGWQQYNEHHYENGWHPGQNDVPAAAFKHVTENDPDLDVVFYLYEASQFYIRFDVFTRINKERKATRLGGERGAAAGSWAYDGNTDTEWYRKVLQGYEDGDPEVMDMCPSPLSGEWAGEPTIDDVLREIGYESPDDTEHDEYENFSYLLDAYETAFSEKWWDVVLSACKKQLGEPELVDIEGASNN